MEALIRFFIDRHLLVHVMVAVVVVLGYASAARAPRETFPNVTMSALFVEATLPGASARDVETKVTIPLERAIGELDGLRNLVTTVSDNVSFSVVELHADFGADRIFRAEKDLRTLVDAITDFPDEMEDEPVIRRLNPRTFPIIQVALSGPTEAVSETAKRLEREIRRLDPVAKVTAVGLQDPELRILVDPERARAYGVTLLDVVGAVQRRNVSSTGGVLETAEARRQVVLWSRYNDPREVGDTILRFLPGGAALQVQDVARIELGREDTGLLAHTNGQPGISLVVSKREEADIVEAADAVRELVEASELPEGVSAVMLRDESIHTRNRLELMTVNGAMGAILVALVLFVFLTPSTGVWVLVGIPTVFLATLALFPAFDLTINMITLTGFVVALGLVVDDAVVVSESIVARRQQGMAPRAAALRGTLDMMRPVTTAAITTVLAFAPMFAIGGMAGKLMRTLPVVVILALSLSLLESFFILPAHMSAGGSQAPPPKRAFVLYLERLYRRQLEWVQQNRLLVVGLFSLAFLVVMGLVAPMTPIKIFPQDDSESLFIKISMPLGTPLERTEAVALDIERQLPLLLGPDLAAVTARIGHQEPAGRGFQERNRGAAENEAVVTAIFQILGREKTSSEWMALLEEKLIVADGARVVFEAEFFGPPIGMPVTLHVESNDDEVRRASAQEIAQRIAALKGVSNVEIDERPGTPQIDLNLDYQKLALRGLQAEDVALTLKTAFFGLQASEHRDLDDTTSFRVLFDPSARRSLDSLLETPVRSQSGELVRLRDVVNPVEVPSVSRIFHRNGTRTATVTAGFTPGSDRSALATARWLEREILPDFAGVPGLSLHIGGEAVETQETTADIGLTALLALVGITLAISLMLGSFLEAFFVIAIVPFSAAAVVLTFFLHDRPLSLFAMLGAVGLAGVVVNSSIVMVDSIHRRVGSLEADADDEARREAVLDAVVGRLRPILVTTLTTLGGVLPTAYGIGGYDAMVAPMSLALGWGLLFSTSVTLLLVPALYTLAGDIRAMAPRLLRGNLTPRLRREESSANL
ncbi:MAG: efflux RND transporter permease subunit [Deltaproteobacteria bacterium]|nr:efflux RND transporter permease subunit [Deltaproteobacteria bacterium]MBW2417872.1 efflux RND transporter permease subunit [Deltaproteobacteria bacterium]